MPRLDGQLATGKLRQVAAGCGDASTALNVAAAPTRQDCVMVTMTT